MVWVKKISKLGHNDDRGKKAFMWHDTETARSNKSDEYFRLNEYLLNWRNINSFHIRLGVCICKIDCPDSCSGSFTHSSSEPLKLQRAFKAILTQVKNAIDAWLNWSTKQLAARKQSVIVMSNIKRILLFFVVGCPVFFDAVICICPPIFLTIFQNTRCDRSRVRLI
jgi:hypothetical protein